MGMAAACDANKIRGGVVQVNQHTGKRLHTYFAVPAGKVGAERVEQQAGDGTSGLGDHRQPRPSAGQVYDAFSIVRLSATTLVKQEKWTVPTRDHGRPGLRRLAEFFSATIGGMATTWSAPATRTASTTSGGAPTWPRVRSGSARSGRPVAPATARASRRPRTTRPGSTLFVAANQTTIGTTAFQGSVRALNPATGAVMWEQGLGCLPDGSPTLNATTHVLAVPLYGCVGTGQARRRAVQLARPARRCAR